VDTHREKDAKEAAEILSKPAVGGMDICQRCGHHQWEHNMDIVVDGKIVRPRSAKGSTTFAFTRDRYSAVSPTAGSSSKRP